MNQLRKPFANICILRRTPSLRAGMAAFMATVAIAGSAYASGNAADCEGKDKPALAALDQKILAAGNTPIDAQSIAAYKALLEQRVQLLAQATEDCDAACQADKKLEASLSTQLEKLLDAKSDPLNTGPASVNYEMRVKALQQELNAAAVLAQKDCGPVFAGFPPGTGRIRPDYMILTVVYAPPGSSKTGAGNVDYATQSAMGTSVGISDSFANKLSIDTTFSGGAFGDDASLEIDFSTSTDRTDKSELDVTKTQKGEIKIPGPAFDGVDHNSDRIYLWLNPAVTVNQGEKSASWTLGVDGPTMDVNYAEVGWLKDPTKMPPGVTAAFQKAGIQVSDYATILSADPFANGSTAIDPSRFVELAESYPFEPVDSPTAMASTDTVTLTSDTKKISSVTGTESVGLTITVSAKVSAVFASVSLKVSDGFTYTHSKSLQSSTDTTQSAAFTIGQPAYGYAGGASIFVYWDTIFQTFMFANPSDASTAPVITTGSLVDRAGAPIAKKPLTVSIDGQEYKTMTNSKGVYKIYGLEK